MRARSLSLQYRALVVELDVLIHTQTHTTHTHLHTHRDVKLDNLLLDSQRNIRVVDFGFSVSFQKGQKLRKATPHSQKSSMHLLYLVRRRLVRTLTCQLELEKACGSPSYAAPEIVARRPYSPPGVDVWSLGVVLYAMVCGYFPFQGSNNQDLCRKIVKGRFECPSFMSAECRDLVLT